MTRTMVKRVLQIVSGLALVNLVVLIGLTGFLFGTGRLDAERIDQIGEVLKGNWPADDGPDVATTLAAAPAQDSSAKIHRDEEIEEILRRRFDRQRREIADQRALVDAARLVVLRQREGFEQEKHAWEQAKLAWQRERQMDGFAKELEYLSSIKSKQAKELLRLKADPDVVKVLMEMDTRKGKKIVDECKTPEERAWIARILEQIRRQNDLAADQLADAESAE